MMAPPSAPIAAVVLASAAPSAVANQTTPTAQNTLARWRPWIAEASQRFGVPQAWITAVMRVESGGRLTSHGQAIVSRAGAMGLMQLMPATWGRMRQLYQLGPDPFAPRDNILAGAAYLRALYTRYGYPNLFAAYNAGPTRLEDYLVLRRALPLETRAYLTSLRQPVLNPPTVRQAPLIRARPGLFFPLHADNANRPPGAADALFTPLAALSTPPR